MKQALLSLLQWFGRALSDGRTGSPSVKRLGYLLGLVVLSVIAAGIAGGLLGLAWAVREHPAQAVDMGRTLASALEWLGTAVVAAAAGGYVGGKAVERKGGGSDGGA